MQPGWRIPPRLAGYYNMYKASIELALYGAAALATLWSIRILVAGSYYSIWDLLWYNKSLPGVLPIILFLAGLPLASSPGTAKMLLLPLAAGALILGDDVRLLSPAAALAAAGGMALLQASGPRLPLALAIGMASDSFLHVAARGLDPLEYVWGRLLLALILAGLYLGPVGARPPSIPLAAGLAALELGLAYPSAVLHYTGHETYSLGLYAFTGGLLSLGVMLGFFLSRLHRDTGILIVLSFAGMVIDGAIGLGLMVLSLAGLGSLLSYEKPGSRLRALAGGFWIVVAGFLGAAVYVYPYVGLWFMADSMEALVLAAVTVLGLAGWPGEEEYEELSREEVIVDYSMLVPVALALLAVGAASVLQAEPLAVEPVEGVIKAYTLNLHQGYDWRGRLNGRESASIIVEAARGGGVICLQEVDAGRLTSMYTDMPLALRSRGVMVAYQPAIEDTYGVAVAAAGVEKVGGVLLPSTGEQRAAVKANASGIIAVSAHLGLNPAERALQAQALVDYALKYPEALLLCGDFNEPAGEAIDYISKYYIIAWPGEATCCQGTGEETVIDFIAVREGRGIVENVRVIPAPSDHMMVYAEIRLVEEG